MRPPPASSDISNPSLAVLDGSGRIVWVNLAWREFGRANGLPPEYEPVSKNYLSLTRRATDEFADDIGERLRELLNHGGPPFTAVYPCHAPSTGRWFRLYATAMGFRGEPHYLLVHQRIPDRELPSGGGSQNVTDHAVGEGAERLITYTVSSGENGTEALLMAFDAIGIDGRRHGTTLHDCLATDALDELYRENGDFRLRVSIWGHPVVFRPESITIHAATDE